MELKTLKQIAAEVGKTPQALRKRAKGGQFQARGTTMVGGKPAALYDRDEVLEALAATEALSKMQDHAACLRDMGLVKVGRPKRKAAPPPDARKVYLRLRVRQETAEALKIHCRATGKEPGEVIDGLASMEATGTLGMCPDAVKAGWVVDQWIQCCEHDYNLTTAEAGALAREAVSKALWDFYDAMRARLEGKAAPPDCALPEVEADMDAIEKLVSEWGINLDRGRAT